MIKRASVQRKKHNAIQVQQSLVVAVPQTAIGWQLQFLIGTTLLVLCQVLMNIGNFTWLVNRPLKMASSDDKHH